MDRDMRIVRETRYVGRPIHMSSDIVVTERGPLNYHCAECGTLLIREAAANLSDVLVLCPVCLSLNEPRPTREFPLLTRTTQGAGDE